MTCSRGTTPQRCDRDTAYDPAKIEQEVLLLTADNFYWIHRRHLAEAAIKHLTSEALKGARICIRWERAAEIAPKIVAFAAK